MNYVRKTMTFVILICSCWQFGITYHGTIIKLDFLGWAPDSRKCVFYMKVSTTGLGCVYDELVIVGISNENLNIKQYITYKNEKELEWIKKEDCGEWFEKPDLIKFFEAEEIIKNMNLVKTVNLEPRERTLYLPNIFKKRSPDYIHFDSDTVLESFEPEGGFRHYTIYRRISLNQERILFIENIGGSGRSSRTEKLLGANISPDNTKLFLNIHNYKYSSWPSFCIIDLSNMELIENKIFDLLMLEERGYEN